MFTGWQWARVHECLVRQLTVSVLFVQCCTVFTFCRCLWDYRHQKSVVNFVGHQGPVVCMIWDAESNHLISGSRDATVRSWDVRNGKCLHVMSGHTDWVKCLSLDEDLLLR